MFLSLLRLRLQHNKTSVRTAVRRNHKRSVQRCTAARRQKMFRGERTRFHAFILPLCTVLMLSGATNAENDLSTCALQCEVLPKKTETKCTLTADPLKLNCSREDYSNILRNVVSLDLSDNNLTQVPTRMFPYCTSLTELSLAQNNIKTIKPGTFSDLRNLTCLDLSFNDLREWIVNRSNNELQSLNHLDATGNEHWLPSKQLLQLNNLTTVRGVKISKYCVKCSLMKGKNILSEVNSTSKSNCSRREHKWSNPRRWEWHDQIQYGKSLDFIKLGFWPTCLCDKVCFIHQVVLPYQESVSDVAVKAYYCLYATSSVALVVNITVFLVIVFNKSLRGDLAVCLVLNITLCDVLIGLATVLHAKFNFITLYIDYLKDYTYYFNIDLLRNIMGSILTCAVVSQVFGSFILTIEKFFKIVFARKPDIRIRKRGAILFLFLSWSVSLTFAILPAFEVGRTTYPLLGIPLPVDQSNSSYSKAPVGIAAVSQIVLLVIQLTSFVLYLPIFIVAKKSGANVGIKREATIARKIALLVFTNLIFFTFPVVLGIFQNNIWEESGKRMYTNWQDHAITEFQWVLFALLCLSALCVSINSVLNPFLYALRHPKIKQQLQPIVSHCRTVLSECFVNLRQRLHCHLNTVQQENDMEMQDTKL